MAVDLQLILGQAAQLDKREKLKLIAQLSAQVAADEQLEQMRQMDERARGSRSLEQILEEQDAKPWRPPQQPVWPEEEDVEDFIAWRNEQRRLDRQRQADS